MRSLAGLVVLVACSDQSKVDEAYARGVKDGVGKATKVNAELELARVEIVKREVLDFAFDAYTQWAGEHLQKSCPDRLDDLLTYMKHGGPRDLWGNRYVMFCGSSLPAGVKGGIAVKSFGPDGKDGTADDIKSWE